jgi:hypothetical protein
MNKNEFFEKFSAKVEELTNKYPALMAAFLTSIEQKVSFVTVILIISEDPEAQELFVSEMENGGTEEFADFIDELNKLATGAPFEQEKENLSVELPQNIENFINKILE